MAAAADGSILRALVEFSSDGLVALDANGLIVEANETFAGRVDRSRHHLLGKPLIAFLPLDERRSLRHALNAEEGVDLEIHLGGAGKPAPLYLRPVKRAEGVRFVAILPAQRGLRPPERAERHRSALDLDRFFLRFPHAVIGVGTDLRVVFANRRARTLLGADALRVGRPLIDASVDGALGALAKRLTSLPAPRKSTNLALSDGRLLRVSGVAAQQDEPAILMIEEVTEQQQQGRVLSEFVRNAAHQLRTPLAGITAALEVLESGAKDNPADRDHFLAHVRQQTERLSRLSRGLLVLARAQSGEAPLLDIVPLRPVLDELAAAARPRNGVELVVDCQDSVVTLCEPDLLREALHALIENALAHTSEGSVRVVGREAGDRTSIEVMDTGPGVLPEHRDRLFEPFYRTQSSGEGFGLGLAIASQAATVMGGELEVDANGDGARFTLRLPGSRTTA